MGWTLVLLTLPRDAPIDADMPRVRAALRGYSEFEGHAQFIELPFLTRRYLAARGDDETPFALQEVLTDAHVPGLALELRCLSNAPTRTLNVDSAPNPSHGQSSPCRSRSAAASAPKAGALQSPSSVSSSSGHSRRRPGRTQIANDGHRSRRTPGYATQRARRARSPQNPRDRYLVHCAHATVPAASKQNRARRQEAVSSAVRNPATLTNCCQSTQMGGRFHSDESGSSAPSFWRHEYCSSFGLRGGDQDSRTDDCESRILVRPTPSYNFRADIRRICSPETRLNSYFVSRRKR